MFESKIFNLIKLCKWDEAAFESVVAYIGHSTKLFFDSILIQITPDAKFRDSDLKFEIVRI